MSERSENVELKPAVRRGRVTLEDVATATGLGRTTISDILNRDEAGRYSDQTRKLVAKAVRELGYAPARAAQQLARGRSGLIGLLLTRDFTNPFFARVADLVERTVRERGYRLQLAIAAGDQKTELDRIRQMQGDAVEGLIVGPVYEQLDIEQHRSVFGGGLPMVLFGGPFDSEFDHVALDHQAGWRVRIEYLKRQGHQRIAVLCLPPSRETSEPTNPPHLGLQLMKRAGVLDLDWVQWQPDTGHFADSYGACLKFARRWKTTRKADRPTAAICLNDQVAMTALSAFAQQGIRVPADLSIVGYDNLPESAYLVPPLTTVDNNVNEQMEACVELLIDRIAHPGRERVVRTIRPKLVMRESILAIEP